MALIYNQKILDLGEHGLLILTLDSSMGAPPLPAHKLGYARWVDRSNAEADRFSLCTRRVPRTTLVEQVEERRKKFAGAVPSVKGLLEWVAREVCDDYVEAPTGAFALEGGRVLLAFCASSPHAFRLVDVVGSRILWEESASDLRKRLGVKVPAYARMFLSDAPVIYAAGARHVCIHLGQKIDVLRVADTGMEACKWAVLKNWASCDFGFTNASLLIYGREDGNVRLVPLEGAGGIVAYASPLKRKAMSGFAWTPYADRFALSHPGGTIEIMNGNCAQERVLRPIPRAGGKDPLHVGLSPKGRYLVAGEWNQTRLVDLDELRVADIALPDGDVSFDRMSFSPEPIYRATWANTDRGGFVLENKVLLHTPFDALDWQALAPIDGTRKASAKAKKATQATLDRIAERWRNPALALSPAKRATGWQSKLYGLPQLRQGIEWPKHEGHPMLLLCQIDLAEVAARMPTSPLPKQGGLLFFVATDEEGEPLLNDSFNPVAVRVLWLPSLAEAPAAGVDVPSAPEQAIKLEASASDLPQADAAIVLAADLADEDYEIYRVLIDERLPNGAAGGHRLGGYPHLLQSNTLEAEAHYLASGAYPGDDARGAALAAKWRLLLQLDSDDVFMWGTDSGLLYFLIHDDDLRAANFSRVVALSAGC